VSGVPPDLASGCRRAQLIGFALVASIFIDGAIVQLIRATRAPFSGFAPGVPVDTLRMVFVVLVVADFVLIRFMRSQILSAPARGARPSTSADEVTRRLSTASIVTLAIGLSIAINGLVLFLIGGRPLDFYGFAVVSLLALAVHFPRLAQWEEWAKDSARRV
jgi:hypothetical protein